MAINAAEKKLAELILYISRKCEDDKTFGATKLNTILFYADFTHYGQYGQSITRAAYQRLESGPAPRRLLPVLAALEGREDLAVQTVTCSGHKQTRTVALREPDLSLFSGTEIGVVNDVMDAFWEVSANDVREHSRDFPGWKIAEVGEDVPYESVFIGEGELTQAEKDYALELI